MLKSLFKPRPAKSSGQSLYRAAVDQARNPQFYLDLHAPDRIDVRFELYALHVGLLLRRLSGQGDEARETAQALFDGFIGSLDDALRELGVGDLAVARKMRTLGEAIYGRIRALGEALDVEPAPDGRKLEALIARTVFGDETALAQARPLANYVLRARQALLDQPLTEILEGRPSWPQPKP